jgi:hypothetical protein
MDPDSIPEEVSSLVDEVMSGLGVVSQIPAVLLMGAAEAESNR